MKKLISKIGVITFSLSPIATIASTPSSSPISASPQFKLAQSFQTRLRKSFKNSKWVKQTQSNSNSNITDGEGGTIFEDSRGNLWSMGGFLTPPQKYNYQTKKWIKESSGWKRSRKKSQNVSTIFFEKLRGTIFEDSRGNLWSMGYDTPLQKYDYNTMRWTEETRASSNSNIIEGNGGAIFEDSRGNLWSMATGTPLQKYNYQTQKWTAETSESSGNNITDGFFGTIFEDSRGNLWSMGYETPLQKYNYNTKKWTEETSKSSGNNITDGNDGTIFEDTRGNLWSMGYETPLQKYNYQTKKWTAETSKSSGNNITDGYGGKLFEDSRGNLWSMGYETPLQKYNYQTQKWTAETSESSGSNITDGNEGTIFEDSRGNLWSMGYETPLQKLTPTKETSIDELKVKDFGIEFKTRINTNSKIAILIKGYKKYTSNLFTHLRYRKKIESSWKIVKKRTMMLDAAEYEFKWVLGDEEILATGQRIPQKTITKSDGSLKISFTQPNDIAKVKAFLNTLSSQVISSLANNSKLVSSITKLEVLKLIQAASGYSELTIDQQALIAEDLIFISESSPGKLKVTITYDGQPKVFLAPGFLTIAQDNINKVKTFFAWLINGDLNSLASSDKLVGAINAKQVLAKLQTLSAYNDLTNDQRALVTANLITTTEDSPGTLKVTITFKGETYELIKDGFKLTLQAEANKFQDFASIDTIKSKAASLKASSKNVISIFKTINGYQRPANLASDIAITQVIVKKSLNLQTQKMTFELTISRQEEEVKKDIIVTFRKESGWLSTEKIVGISLGSILGVGIISFLIFYLVRKNKK